MTNKVNFASIFVTNNGYLVQVSGRDAFGNIPNHENSWTFESMKALQARLPEILQPPVEKCPKK